MSVSLKIGSAAGGLTSCKNGVNNLGVGSWHIFQCKISLRIRQINTLEVGLFNILRLNFHKISQKRGKYLIVVFTWGYIQKLDPTIERIEGQPQATDPIMEFQLKFTVKFPFLSNFHIGRNNHNFVCIFPRDDILLPNRWSKDHRPPKHTPLERLSDRNQCPKQLFQTKQTCKDDHMSSVCDFKCLPYPLSFSVTLLSTHCTQKVVRKSANGWLE